VRIKECDFEQRKHQHDQKNSRESRDRTRAHDRRHIGSGDLRSGSDSTTRSSGGHYRGSGSTVGSSGTTLRYSAGSIRIPGAVARRGSGGSEQDRLKAMRDLFDGVQ